MASSPDYDLSPDELNELLSAVMPEIPGYRVMRLLGRGGMSFVYLGLQESLDRPVAIKVIRPDALKDEVSKLRFEKEARTTAKLQHPCIVGIHEVGRTEQGLLYYVMPYLSKGHLGQRPVTRDQPWIISVLHALLWALDYAHLRGMVHRDVKPENVLFDNADRPVLTDFGIALNRRERARITGSGLALGSGDYMAPEQARGEVVDGRADLYSLGVLTYELLVGELPYVHHDPLSLALMHAMDPIPRLPAELQHWQAFIDRAMAKARDQRFADAQEMMAALERVETECARASRSGSASTHPAAQDGSSRSARLAIPPRWRAPALAGFVVLIAGLAMAAGWWLGPRSQAPPTTTATNRTPIATDRADATDVTDVIPSAPADTTPSPPRPPDAPALPDAVDAAAGAGAEAVTGASASEAQIVEVAEGVEGVEGVAQDTNLPPPEQAATGEPQLAAAQRQITQHRLTQPPGDNALQSLLEAQRLAPDLPGLSATGEIWLRTARPYLVDALAGGRTDAARGLWQGARKLVDALRLQAHPAWTGLEQAVRAPYLARLESSLAAADLTHLRAVKAEVLALGLDPRTFEPLWSRAIISARPGERLEGGAAVVLTRLPEGGRPGLAALPRAVTRGEYAAFAKATGRAASTCRIRTALMTLKRRSWDAPGFDQAGDHPVVCVSIADARAYAAWLGARDGVEYRLPTGAEWKTLAAMPNFAEACRAQRIVCAGKGTHGANSGPFVAAGIHAMHGNVREWPADCGADCREHPTLGYSWRDAPGAPAGKDALVEARFGYDDVGFRLVRAVTPAEIEQQ